MRFLRRLHEGSDGQGVVEVLVVVILFGLLTAVGAPAFFHFQNRKADSEARGRLLAAVPAAQVYRDRHGSYSGLDAVDLNRIDPRISMTLVVSSARRGRFCLTESVNGRTWSLAGPVRREAYYSPQPNCSRA